MSTDGPVPPRRKPFFEAEASRIMQKLKGLSETDISRQMKVSGKLAAETKQRIAAFREDPPTEETTAALFAFQGDVYEALDARSLPRDSLDWADQHLRILSGLYGLIRPLSGIQSYRLEMGYPIALEKSGTRPTAFWKPKITEALKEDLQVLSNPLILDLASKEYTAAIDFAQLKARVITPRFKTRKNGELKTVAIHAKRGRGALAGFCCRNRIVEATELQGFAEDGWSFFEQASSENEPVFIRTG